MLLCVPLQSCNGGGKPKPVSKARRTGIINQQQGFGQRVACMQQDEIFIFILMSQVDTSFRQKELYEEVVFRQQTTATIYPSMRGSCMISGAHNP